MTGSRRRLRATLSLGGAIVALTASGYVVAALVSPPIPSIGPDGRLEVIEGVSVSVGLWQPVPKPAVDRIRLVNGAAVVDVAATTAGDVTSVLEAYVDDELHPRLSGLRVEEPAPARVEGGPAGLRASYQADPIEGSPLPLAGQLTVLAQQDVVVLVDARAPGGLWMLEPQVDRLIVSLRIER